MNSVFILVADDRVIAIYSSIENARRAGEVLLSEDKEWDIIKVDLDDSSNQSQLNIYKHFAS